MTPAEQIMEIADLKRRLLVLEDQVRQLAEGLSAAAIGGIKAAQVGQLLTRRVDRLQADGRR